MVTAKMSQTAACPECDSEAIIFEDFNYVCSNCGNVISECPELFTAQSDKNYDGTTAGKSVTIACDQNKATVVHEQLAKHCWNLKQHGGQQPKKITETVSCGIELILGLCKQLNISKSIMEKSIDLYKKVTADEEFKFCNSNVKQCLALGCLYMISNKEDNPITLTELANNSDFMFDHVGAVLIRLQRTHPEILENNVRTPETLVPFYLFKHDFDPKEKMLIGEYCHELIWMLRQALLIQGYNPINVIYASLFYAWKAIHPDRARTTVNEFCDKFLIKENVRSLVSVRNKVDFIYECLLDFAKCSPLLSNLELTKDTITLKLVNIFSMKQLILFNHCKNSMDGAKRMKSCDKKNEANIDEDEEQHATNSNTTTTTIDYSEELSDSEIDSYIRTDEEICNIKKLEMINSENSE